MDVVVYSLRLVVGPVGVRDRGNEFELIKLGGPPPLVALVLGTPSVDDDRELIDDTVRMLELFVLLPVVALDNDSSDSSEHKRMGISVSLSNSMSLKVDSVERPPAVNERFSVTLVFERDTVKLRLRLVSLALSPPVFISLAVTKFDVLRIRFDAECGLG